MCVCVVINRGKEGGLGWVGIYSSMCNMKSPHMVVLQASLLSAQQQFIILLT